MMEFYIFSDEYFMGEAIKEAKSAEQEGEIPIGAVVVWKKRIIARSHNMTERLNDVTAHAEMLAITAATNYIGGKYLKDCALYVTIEPCPMCASALSWAQIGKIVFGAHDPKHGYSLISSSLLHPQTLITSGIRKEECAEMISEFFKKRRV
ncbi:MAG: nucleoside deaminase [Lentimicrobium sp.]|jgi:tRNA(adenine34) deaminase